MLAAAPITASGVRRSCEIDASIVLRRLSLSAATARFFRGFRQLRALERKADLAGEGLEQVQLLRQQHAPAVARQDRQHAEALRLASPSGT